MAKVLKILTEKSKWKQITKTGEIKANQLMPDGDKINFRNEITTVYSFREDGEYLLLETGGIVQYLLKCRNAISIYCNYVDEKKELHPSVLY